MIWIVAVDNLISKWLLANGLLLTLTQVGQQLGWVLTERLGELGYDLTREFLW
jgi:hypothetical protein